MNPITTNIYFKINLPLSTTVILILDSTPSELLTVKITSPAALVINSFLFDTDTIPSSLDTHFKSLYVASSGLKIPFNLNVLPTSI